MSDWKAFLVENGAKFDDSQLVSFSNPEQGQPALPQEAMLSDLSDYGIIKVSGDDAESFLQNQLTNDIRNISETKHQISAWCTPKGRIIADFRIYKREDDYFLIIAADLLAHVIKKLQMYVMMSKVTIDDVSNTLAHFAFSGNNANETLQKALSNITAPTELDQAIHKDGISILRISGSIERFEFIAETEDAKNLWNALKSDATLVNSNRWHYLNILAGLPHISKASSESWIPQMVNFIAVNGVDFKKGCYPGQEVVARLNYLGKTKRRMYHLVIDTNNIPAINDTIMSDNDAQAGKILNAVINPDGKIEALAILKIAETENQLSLTTDNNSTITLLDLPYSLEK